MSIFRRFILLDFSLQKYYHTDMAILKIIRYPDPVLKKKAEPVREITWEIKRLVDDMAETMYAAPGVGLAAPQIGRSIRVIVIDVNPKEEEKRDLITLINPEIVEHSGDIAWEEGCLSIPDYSSDVKRAERVVAKGLDINGNERVVVGEGLLSVVLQHEIDHLDGILFIDRLGPIKRDLIKRRLRKQARVEAI